MDIKYAKTLDLSFLKKINSFASYYTFLEDDDHRAVDFEGELIFLLVN